VDGGPLDVVARTLACPLRMHPRLRLYAPVHLDTAWVEPCSSNRLGLRTLCPRRCALHMCGGGGRVLVLVFCAAALSLPALENSPWPHELQKAHMQNKGGRSDPWTSSYRRQARSGCSHPLDVACYCMS
jgi:hypothetical protein